MLKLVRFLKGYKKQLIAGPLFKLTEAVFELIVPIITAMIIDNGVLKKDEGYVWKMGAVLFGLGAVGLMCALICQYSASIASQGFGTVLRNEMYKHINTFSHKEIDKLGTPSLITRITNDVNQLQFAVAMLIRLVIRAPFLAIGAVVMSLIIDVKLSIIFLIITPIIAIILYIIMKKSVPFFKAIQRKLDSISRISREGLSGARVIRAFSRQKSEQERFGKAASDQAEVSINVGKLSALLNPLTYCIMNFGIIAIIWFGGKRVESGGLSTGQIVAFVNYMTQTYLALVVVANLVVTFTKAAASAARVNEVFDTKTSVTEIMGNSINIPKEVNCSVKFENVCFSYSDNDRYALKKIDLTVNKGETIGIIGGTGSGKSTLVKLIERFYDVNEGNIYVNGINVREYPLRQLRSMIGMVSQKSVIFSGTVKSNLEWGKENAGEEDIIKALEIAQAADFVSKLPEGINSRVEQDGKNFSGGQKQRLSIARALVSDPEILILDDSSSALDFATDAALRKAIKNRDKGATVFIISQRAGAIKNSDKIIVLDKGELVGTGTHKELFYNCDIYKEICMSQLSEEEVAAI